MLIIAGGLCALGSSLDWTGVAYSLRLDRADGMTSRSPDDHRRVSRRRWPCARPCGRQP